MGDRLEGRQRERFFKMHEVFPPRRPVTWHGLSLDEMTKAELRIVVDNCALDVGRLCGLGIYGYHVEQRKKELIRSTVQ